MEVGAGVSLAPNATRAIRSLGILEQVRALGYVPDRAAIKHYRTGSELTGYSIGAQVESKWGVPYVQIHRADLHGILVAAIRNNDADAIQLGARVDTLTQDAEQVTVNTPQGKFSGKCLIGADGIRSSVRTLLYGGNAPDFLGYVAWRGVVPMDMLNHKVDPDTAVFIGAQKSVLRYKVHQGNSVNIVAFSQSDTWAEEGWSLRADPVEIRTGFQGWHPEVVDLLDCLCKVGAFKWGLFGRAPLPQWQSGRVTLIGDAAHPMLPFRGQGAAMAIEDGTVLARAIAESASIEQGLQRFEKARYERATTTVSRSNEQGLRIHSYPVDELTNLPVPKDDFSEYAYDASTLEIPQ
jgi:salicylate hydroxylase